MAKISQEKLRRTDKLVLKSKNNGDVVSTVFPNGIQAGVGQPGFNKGVKFPNLTSAPSNLTNVLYSLDGQLFFGAAQVGSGAGGGGFFTEASSGKIFTTGSLGISTSGAAKTSLDVVHDYSTTTFENQLTDGEGGGDILKYGTGTTVAGELYYLHTDGSWADADADAVASGADQLLGIALGTSPSSNGMLLKGFAKIASTLVNGTAVIGKAVFVSTTAGEYDFTKPSGSNDIVRIVGYCVDIDSSDILLYFNPDPTFIEIS